MHGLGMGPQVQVQSKELAQLREAQSKELALPGQVEGKQWHDACLRDVLPTAY